LEGRYRPDGFNIGWNCYAAGGQATDHAHMHVLLRFADEPKAGQGIRWPLRQPDNRRRDPQALGGGNRDFPSALGRAARPRVTFESAIGREWNRQARAALLDSQPAVGSG